MKKRSIVKVLFLVVEFRVSKSAIEDATVVIRGFHS